MSASVILAEAGKPVRDSTALRREGYDSCGIRAKNEGRVEGGGTAGSSLVTRMAASDHCSVASH